MHAPDSHSSSGTAAGAEPLVVVSNRLPFTVQRREGGYSFARAPGGLVTALDAVLTRCGGTWVGWPGVATTDGDAEPPCPPPLDGVRYRAVALSTRDVQLYYGGFANRTLWPLFHYFIGRTHIEAQSWRAYERVNERFAETALAATSEHAVVWVHDDHLALVPGMLRRRAPATTIGFFLHIPFPAADVFRVLPWARPGGQGRRRLPGGRTEHAGALGDGRRRSRAARGVDRQSLRRRRRGRGELQDAAGRSPDLHVVIVSGRALSDVRARVGIPDLTYVGEHGYEIEGPGIGRSIRVGPATRGDGGPSADLFLPGPDDVVQLVRRLASAGTQ